MVTQLFFIYSLIIIMLLMKINLMFVENNYQLLMSLQFIMMLCLFEEFNYFELEHDYHNEPMFFFNKTKDMHFLCEYINHLFLQTLTLLNA